MEYCLTIDSLSKKYRKFVALNDVTMRVPQGGESHCYCKTLTHTKRKVAYGFFTRVFEVDRFQEFVYFVKRRFAEQ